MGPAIALSAFAYLSLLSTGQNVFWLMLAVPIWPLLGVGVRRMHDDRVARAFVTVGGAFLVTLFAVCFTVLPLGHGAWQGPGHPAPGEHPVDVIAGLPWPGIEGNTRGLAHEFVPLTMGLDALAANFTFFLLAASWWMRRASAARCHELVPMVTLLAPIAAFAGSIRLALLFD